MIKKIVLRDQDEILLALGVQDRKLRALEKEFKIDATVTYNEDGQGAELSLKGTHSRLDKALARLKKILEMGGGALLTADHGNADKMIAEDGSPFTAHTTNPVPVVLVNDSLKGAALRDGGVLADLAPTLLDMMGIAVPVEMTGKSLIVR